MAQRRGVDTWARRGASLGLGTAAVWAVACVALVALYGPPEGNAAVLIGLGSLADIVFIIVIRSIRR